MPGIRYGRAAWPICVQIDGDLAGGLVAGAELGHGLELGNALSLVRVCPRVRGSELELELGTASGG